MRLLAFALLAIAVTAETDLEPYPLTPYLCVYPNPESTVKSYPEHKFNSIDDAKSLNASDPSNVIALLTNRSARQRRKIGTSYKNIHNMTLLEALNDYGDNDYRYAIECMMLPVAEVYARVFSTNKLNNLWDMIIFEITPMASIAEMEDISTIYENLTGDILFNKFNLSYPPLPKHMLTKMLTGYRPEKCSVPAEYTDVSNDDEKLADFMLTANYRQIRLVNISHPDLYYSISPEIFFFIAREKVKFAKDPFQMIAGTLSYFLPARHQKKAIVRIIVTRSEIDLENIKKAYTTLYNISLYNDIKMIIAEHELEHHLVKRQQIFYIHPAVRYSLRLVTLAIVMTLCEIITLGQMYTDCESCMPYSSYFLIRQSHFKGYFRDLLLALVKS